MVGILEKSIDAQNIKKESIMVGILRPHTVCKFSPPSSTAR